MSSIPSVPPGPPVSDPGPIRIPPTGISRFPWPRLPPPPTLRPLLLGAVAAFGFYILASAISSFNDFRVGEIAVYAIALAGLSLLTGTNGQISLGQGAFMAVGAYTLRVLMTHTHLPLVVD